MVDLETIRAREQATTEGPWRNRASRSGQYWEIVSETDVIVGHNRAYGGGVYSEDNAEFLAHARTDIPALLEEVEALRRLRDAVRAWREMRRSTPTKPKPEAAALMAAYDALPSQEQP